MVCPHGQGGGIKPVRTFCFCSKRGRVNISRFCADVLYGRPLKILRDRITQSTYVKKSHIFLFVFHQLRPLKGLLKNSYWKEHKPIYLKKTFKAKTWRIKW